MLKIDEEDFVLLNNDGIKLNGKKEFKKMKI